MIGSLYKFLSGQERNSPPGESHDGRALQLATAALLMEVATADYDISQAERDAVRRVVQEKFSVSPEEAIAIAERAERDTAHVTSCYPFTRMLTEACSMEERVEIVSMLWEVTAADGIISAHETHLVRKIAGLLYVPHSQLIRTRLQHEDAG